jgi:pimeloyl-ACP methyl ester carboxylesterase
MRTKTVVVNGVRSPYLETGPADTTEAVVFVHGNPGFSADWAELAGQVGTFARAIALDMPGFGKADKPDNFDYTVDGYARHLGGALEQLGVRRAHLVVHDFGGPWGMTWAAAHPQAYASLTMINIGVTLGYRWHYLARIWQTPGMGEFFMATTTRTGFHVLMKKDNPQPLPKAYVDELYDHFDKGTRRAVLRLYRATRDVEPRAQQLAAALRAHQRPALAVWGVKDPYLPVALLERQAEVFDNLEIVRLERSGHWPFVDDPAGVAAAVIPFLQRQVGRQADAARANGAGQSRPDAVRV